MKTTKRLVMVFKTDADTNVSISVDNPKDSLKESEIKSAIITKRRQFSKLKCCLYTDRIAALISFTEKRASQ